MSESAFEIHNAWRQQVVGERHSVAMIVGAGSCLCRSLIGMQPIRMAADSIAPRRELFLQTRYLRRVAGEYGASSVCCLRFGTSLLSNRGRFETNGNSARPNPAGRGSALDGGGWPDVATGCQPADRSTIKPGSISAPPSTWSRLARLETVPTH